MHTYAYIHIAGVLLSVPTASAFISCRHAYIHLYLKCSLPESHLHQTLTTPLPPPPLPRLDSQPEE